MTQAWRIAIIGSVLFLAVEPSTGAEPPLDGKPVVKRWAIGETTLSITPGKGTERIGARTRIHFDKDVQFNGNRLTGGDYELGVETVDTDDVHVVIWDRSRPIAASQRPEKEVLRLAFRPESAPPVEDFDVRVEPVVRRDRSDDRRRRRERNDEATLRLRWSRFKVDIEMVMTGVLWRSTPPPEIPLEFQQAWEVALSSLDGLAQESMKKHTQHFADDFESDWDDGGSQEAHEQYVGRMIFDGAFEGSVLKLHNLQWSVNPENGSILFTEMGILGDFGHAALAYRLVETKQGWKIIHLDGPKEE